jgi:hypothetical protein
MIASQEFKMQHIFLHFYSKKKQESYVQKYLHQTVNNAGNVQTESL